ncbi:alpha/beta fold hydrolase [Streptomyces nojiriensis]
MAVVLADSLRFHVQRLPADAAAAGPDRPVVVFLHGLVVDNLSSFYCPLAVPVALAGHETVLYDLRGHGRTERPPTGYDSRTAVRDLFALLGALDLGGRPVHLVGNSYGGRSRCTPPWPGPTSSPGSPSSNHPSAAAGWRTWWTPCRPPR